MSEQEEYGLVPEGEAPEEKPKPTLKTLMDEYHRVKPWRHIKPKFMFLAHGFLAFLTGSVVNYLVAQAYIKPQHVTQIVVALLVFTFLRVNYRTGEKK